MRCPRCFATLRPSVGYSRRLPPLRELSGNRVVLASDRHFSEYTTIRPEDHWKLCPRITSEWPIREPSRGRSDRNGKCGHFYVHSPNLYFKQLEQPDLLKACCVLRSLTG